MWFLILPSSYFVEFFSSNSLWLCDSKAKACFTVVELFLKISQRSVAVELVEVFCWQSHFMALNEKHPALLWKVSVSICWCESFTYAVWCKLAVLQTCVSSVVFPPWMMQVLSILIQFLFLSVVPCRHSLFRDVPEFPLDLIDVFT